MTCDRDHHCPRVKLARLERRQKRLAESIPLPWPKSVVLAMFVIGAAVGAVVLYFLTMGGR